MEKATKIEIASGAGAIIAGAVTSFGAALREAANQLTLYTGNNLPAMHEVQRSNIGLLLGGIVLTGTGVVVFLRGFENFVQNDVEQEVLMSNQPNP